MKFWLILCMCLCTCMPVWADQPTTVLTQWEKDKELTVALPVIDGSSNEILEKAANHALRAAVQQLAKKIDGKGQVTYQVSLNRPSLISILFKAVPANAGTSTYYQALNLDLTSGKTFGLGDFLREGMACREILPANYYELLFSDQGIYSNDGPGKPYSSFTSYAKLAPLMRISEAGRLVKVWRLTQSCAGRELSIPAGSLFAIKLVSNPSTGNRWSSQITNGQGNLYQIGRSFTMPLKTIEGTTGSSGMEILVFAAQKPGQYTVQMNYGRNWDKVHDADNFAFQVKVI